jgi:hypothetical protein
MSRFALVAVGIAVVVSIASGPAFAQKAAQSVVVTNSSANPVPVSGNVNAAVNGTVNVATLPNVNISSMPAVTLGSGATVVIDPLTTVKIADVATNNITRLRVASSINAGAVLVSGNVQTQSCAAGTCWTDFQVPVGKRLVLTNISGSAVLPTGQLPSFFHVSTEGGGNNNFQLFLEPHKLPFSSNPANDQYIFNSTGPFYADPAAFVSWSWFRNSSDGSAIIGVSFQGYLVDCGSCTTTQ